MTLNELIEQRTALKAELDAVNSTVKAVKEQMDANEQLVFKALDEAGIKRIANDSASLSINESIVPEVVDWDKFHTYILDSGDFSLIQRRASSTAYNELLKTGASVPGIEPREVRRLNFKSL